jgi:MFS family permease
MPPQNLSASVSRQWLAEVVDLGAYRTVLTNRETRSALVLGFFVRVPLWAGAVVLTLHVVATLGHTYGEAGLVTAASTIAVAISGPWRGRLLDRVGLRRTVGPSLLVQVVCWSIAPWVSYAPLMALAALAGLFVVPTFSIVRQVILTSTPPEQRRTALSLDSVVTELSFMVGPAIGVVLATSWDTRWALFVTELSSVVAGFVLWVVNPRLTSEASIAEAEPTASDDEGADDDPETTGRRRAIRGFITLPVAAVYVAALTSTLVLTGTDVGIVAALRGFGQPAAIGWVMALWGLGSLLGGLVYGAGHRSIPVFWLLGGLSVSTAPVALAAGVPVFAVLVTVCGFLCAPTIVATVEQLSRLVPERHRGEMMGWHGSAMTAGSALGAPVAGFAIDHGGWQWGFTLVSMIGVVVAVAGAAAAWRRIGEAAAPRRGDVDGERSETVQL